MNIFHYDIENELRLNGIESTMYGSREYDSEFLAGAVPSHTRYCHGRLFYPCVINSIAYNDGNGIVLNHDWITNDKLDNKYIQYHKYYHSLHYGMPIISFSMNIELMIDDFISSMDLSVNGWFLFGSLVIYDLSSSSDDLTDIDLVIITNDVPHGTKFSFGLLDIQTMTVDYFNTHNDGSDELIMQVLFNRIQWNGLERHTLFYNFGEDLNLDVPFNNSKIRHCISGKSSNSYVKSKKKLIVPDDYDKYSSMKSLIHSIRLLNLGIAVSRTDGVSGYSDEDGITSHGIELIRSLYSLSSDVEIVECIENGEIKECYKKLKRIFKYHCGK